MQCPSISHSYGTVGTLCPWIREGDRHGRDHRSAENIRCICQLPNATGRGGGRASPSACLIAADKRFMITMQLTCPDPLKRQAPRREIVQDSQRSRILPADQSATVTTPFQPLDPGIVNEAIPAFFIGRNQQGFWLARDVKGKIGGIFLFEGSALSFARKNSRPLGCATIFPSERFELDLENQGNPLIVCLGPLMRLAMRGWQRMAAFIGKLTEAIERRLRIF
jgi:hypothetical protein